LKRDDWSAALFLMAALIAGGESCRAEGTLSSLLACRDVADAGARLACFDRESAAMASPGAAAVAATAPAAAAPAAAAPAAAAPAAAAAAAVTPPGPVLDPKQQFGLPEREVARQQVAAGARAPDVAKVQARVVGLALTGDGRTVVSLDNDQVWRQLAADADLFLKLGDTVTISRAFLGSFWLATPTKRGSKVTRVR
jgi:hypothetical protein